MMRVFSLVAKEVFGGRSLLFAVANGGEEEMSLALKRRMLVRW